MVKSKSNRKTRSDKFPLTLHKTGQYCKKIKGKLYYFGTNKRQALERYLEQAVYLHAGRPPKPEASRTKPGRGRANLAYRQVRIFPPYASDRTRSGTHDSDN